MVKPMVKKAKPPSLYHFEHLKQHDLRRIAVAAICDMRTIVKYLRGMPLQENMERRIEVALKACDLEKFVRGYDAPPQAKEG